MDYESILVARLKQEPGDGITINPLPHSHGNSISLGVIPVLQNPSTTFENNGTVPAFNSTHSVVGHPDYIPVAHIKEEPTQLHGNSETTDFENRTVPAFSFLNSAVGQAQDIPVMCIKEQEHCNNSGTSNFMPHESDSSSSMSVNLPKVSESHSFEISAIHGNVTDPIYNSVDLPKGVLLEHMRVPMEIRNNCEAMSQITNVSVNPSSLNVTLTEDQGSNTSFKNRTVCAPNLSEPLEIKSEGLVEQQHSKFEHPQSSIHANQALVEEEVLAIPPAHHTQEQETAAVNAFNTQKQQTVVGNAFHAQKQETAAVNVFHRQNKGTAPIIAFHAQEQESAPVNAFYTQKQETAPVNAFHTQKQETAPVNTFTIVGENIPQNESMYETDSVSDMVPSVAERASSQSGMEVNFYLNNIPKADESELPCIKLFRTYLSELGPRWSGIVDFLNYEFDQDFSDTSDNMLPPGLQELEVFLESEKGQEKSDIYNHGLLVVEYFHRIAPELEFEYPEVLYSLESLTIESPSTQNTSQPLLGSIPKETVEKIESVVVEQLNPMMEQIEAASQVIPSGSTVGVSKHLLRSILENVNSSSSAVLSNLHPQTSYPSCSQETCISYEPNYQQNIFTSAASTIVSESMLGSAHIYTVPAVNTWDNVPQFNDIVSVPKVESVPINAALGIENTFKSSDDVISPKVDRTCFDHELKKGKTWYDKMRESGEVSEVSDSVKHKQITDNPLNQEIIKSEDIFDENDYQVEAIQVAKQTVSIIDPVSHGSHDMKKLKTAEKDNSSKHGINFKPANAVEQDGCQLEKQTVPTDDPAFHEGVSLKKSKTTVNANSSQRKVSLKPADNVGENDYLQVKVTQLAEQTVPIIDPVSHESVGMKKLKATLKENSSKHEINLKPANAVEQNGCQREKQTVPTIEPVSYEIVSLRKSKTGVKANSSKCKISLKPVDIVGQNEYQLEITQITEQPVATINPVPLETVSMTKNTTKVNLSKHGKGLKPAFPIEKDKKIRSSKRTLNEVCEKKKRVKVVHVSSGETGSCPSVEKASFQSGRVHNRGAFLTEMGVKDSDKRAQYKTKKGFMNEEQTPLDSVSVTSYLDNSANSTTQRHSVQSDTELCNMLQDLPYSSTSGYSHNQNSDPRLFKDAVSGMDSSTWLPASKGAAAVVQQQTTHGGMYSSSSRNTTAGLEKAVCLIPPSLKEAVGIKVVDSNEALLIILSWRPEWLQQQLDNPDCTPSINAQKNSVTMEYSDYSHHFNTYLPLLLLETWQRIFFDWKNAMKKQFFSYSCDIQHSDIKTNFVELECTHKVKQEVTVYPSEGCIVLLKLFDQSYQVFAYVLSHTFTRIGCGSQTSIKTEETQFLRLCLKTVYKLPNNLLRRPVTVILLTDLKNFLVQVDALKAVNKSILGPTILKPLRPVCTKVILNNGGTFNLSSAVGQIINSICLLDLGCPRITVLESFSIKLLVSVITRVKSLRGSCGVGKILMCCRTLSRLKKIGLEFKTSCSHSKTGFQTVIVGQPTILEDSTEIENMTLEKIIANQQTSAAKNGCTVADLDPSSVIKASDVLLSTVTGCFETNIHKILGSDAITLCILDEADICTEPEMLVPLLYGIKKVIFFCHGPREPRVYNRFSKKHNYHLNLLKRVCHAF